MNEWASADHALAYLARADRIPHRTEGEAVLLEVVPTTVTRILDVGTGNGRLLALLKIDRPHATAVALDFSPTMLQAARERFKDNPEVTVVDHDLDRPLPPLGQFDAVVSSFAIHHCSDARKRSLYAEVYDILTPGGIFCNLEHVSSPTPRLTAQFYRAMHIETPDPSNRLLDLATQLHWLNEIGFQDVDCLWKWRELALMTGTKPG